MAAFRKEKKKNHNKMLIWVRTQLCSLGRRKRVSSEAVDRTAFFSQLLGEETPRGAAKTCRNFPFQIDRNYSQPRFKQ